MAFPAGWCTSTLDQGDLGLHDQGGWEYREKKMWPGNSPDLNPLDCAIWNATDRKACADPASTKS